jgi:hypothetical protein
LNSIKLDEPPMWRHKTRIVVIKVIDQNSKEMR